MSTGAAVASRTVLLGRPQHCVYGLCSRHDTFYSTRLEVDRKKLTHLPKAFDTAQSMRKSRSCACIVSIER